MQLGGELRKPGQIFLERGILAQLLANVKLRGHQLKGIRPSSRQSGMRLQISLGLNPLSRVPAAPLIDAVGATLFTVTETVLPAANVPSSSLAVALIV